MEKFESEVKYISYPLEVVYNKMADLNNLSAIKDRFSDPNFQSAAISASGGKVSESQMQSIAEKVQNMRFDTDSVSLDVNPVGNVTLQIIERELNKTIKFETANSPVPMNMWIQLLPVSTGGCKMRLTVKAELNFFIRKMVEKPLREGVEKIADMLAMIPYGYGN